MVDLGQRNANYVNTIITFLENKEWGLQKQFQHRDVRELRTKDFADFLDKLAKDRPDLSDSTRNMMTATFRNVLKVAVRDGVIDAVPATPRVGGGACRLRKRYIVILLTIYLLTQCSLLISQ